MPDSKKDARGATRTNRRGAGGKRAGAPPGEALPLAALAALGARPNPGRARSGNGSAAAGDAQADPAAKPVTQVLGEIAWLMDQSPRHSAMPVDDLEWLLAPPVMYGQFRMFYKGGVPTGVVLWAQVDDAVAERIDAGNIRLAGDEWQSGSNLRIIDVVAPFGGETEMRELVTRLASE